MPRSRGVPVKKRALNLKRESYGAKTPDFGHFMALPKIAHGVSLFRPQSWLSIWRERLDLTLVFLCHHTEPEDTVAATLNLSIYKRFKCLLGF